MSGRFCAGGDWANSNFTRKGSCDALIAAKLRETFQNGEEIMGAVCLMLQFATMDRAKYDDVMKALDWKNAGAPEGLISHIAGPMKVGWGVVDVWKSQEDFDNFLRTDLRKAFTTAGARMPEMQVVAFDVHNQFP